MDDGLASTLATTASCSTGFRARGAASEVNAESAGFVLLTLPVILYFAILEASPARSTFGKRVLRLRVVSVTGARLSLVRSILRSSVKFAPWELAHFTIWNVVYEGGGGKSAPVWSYVTLGAVYFLVGIYLLTLFVGRSHRTVYDRISGARVIDPGDSGVGLKSRSDSRHEPLAVEHRRHEPPAE